jgi:hypothetical protein
MMPQIQEHSSGDFKLFELVGSIMETNKNVIS